MDRSAFALKKFGKIRVGLIGDGGRMAAQHDAALRLLPDYELISVHLPRQSPMPPVGSEPPLVSGFEVVRHPNVDLVAIVSGGEHAYDLAREAILAGKDVYCDWPIREIIESAETISALARRSGVRYFVGLRPRLSPPIRYMRDLVAKGHCGRIVSLNLTAGPELGAPRGAGASDDEIATVLPITMMHLLDAAFSVAGRPKLLSGLAGSRPHLARLSEAQFCLMGILDSDAMFSAHIATRAGQEAYLKIEVSGDEGSLELCTMAHQFTNASLVGQRKSDRQFVSLAIPKNYQWFFSPASTPSDIFDIANIFAAFAHDLHEGTHLVPGLEDGLLMSKILCLAQRSSASGHRIALDQPDN